MRRMRQELPSACDKADRFLNVMDYRAEELPPQLRPWFWDSVAQGLVLVGGNKSLWAAPRARQAETDHGLAIDTGHHIVQALFMARHGALPAKEVRVLQKWITETLPAERAYSVLLDLITARAAGGAALRRRTPTASWPRAPRLQE